MPLDPDRSEAPAIDLSALEQPVAETVERASGERASGEDGVG